MPNPKHLLADSASMLHIGTFNVNVAVKHDGKVNYQIASLGPAAQSDMSSIKGEFSWEDLWKTCDFDCQGIARLSHLGKVFGLVKYGLYPHSDTERPSYLEIEHLEACPASMTRMFGQAIPRERSLEPVGRWLFWYAVSLGLQYCPGEPEDTLIYVVSTQDAFDYYKSTLGMTYIGEDRLSPQEDGYGFTFTRATAQSFCIKHAATFGSPTS